MKQLRAAGAQKVLPETASGAKTDRAQSRRAVDQLGNGDVLMVTRLETGWRAEGRHEHFRSLFGHPHDHPGLKAGMIDQPYACKFTGDAKIHVDFRGMPRGVKPKPACPGCLARSAWHAGERCR